MQKNKNIILNDDLNKISVVATQEIKHANDAPLENVNYITESASNTKLIEISSPYNLLKDFINIFFEEFISKDYGEYLLKCASQSLFYFYEDNVIAIIAVLALLSVCSKCYWIPKWFDNSILSDLNNSKNSQEHKFSKSNQNFMKSKFWLIIKKIRDIIKKLKL